MMENNHFFWKSFSTRAVSVLASMKSLNGLVELSEPDLCEASVVLSLIRTGQRFVSLDHLLGDPQSSDSLFVLCSCFLWVREAEHADSLNCWKRSVGFIAELCGSRASPSC